jgi:putative ABC transport system permease protein
MIKNFIKITLRNILKHRGYSFINITGLAIGMACCLLITLWVLDELSYDRFHENAPYLYRVEENQHYSGRLFHVNVTPYPIAPAMIEEFPEIQDASRYVRSGGRLFRYGEKFFFEDHVGAVDPSFLTMFTYPLVKGNKESALKSPDSILISQDTAVKYFGSEDPLGKIINIDNKYDFKVTGVLKNVPHNSYLQFKALVPYEFLRKTGRTGERWDSNSILTFVQLQKEATMEQVNRKILNYIRTRVPESKTDLVLMPLVDIHLHAWFGYIKTMGAVQYVYIFSFIAFLVLVIACINFMNLATARSARRAREVGIRKVVGAYKSHLVKQFYGESIIYSFIALIFALIIVQMVLPAFSSLAGKEITLGVAGFRTLLLGLIGISLFTGIVSGSYPALFLSAFQPVKVLNGTLTRGSGAARFRKILVVFQFVLSVFLITGSIVVSKQLNFLKNKNIGYEKEHLLYISLKGGSKSSYQALKNELIKNGSILGVTGSESIPSSIGSNSSGAKWEGKDPNFKLLIGHSRIDYNYVKTLGIELMEGRDFSEAYPGDKKKNFLINEELLKIMKKDSAVGERFSFLGCDGVIVGVMKNFHYGSVKYAIEPLVLILDPERINCMVVRIPPGNISANIDKIKQTWKTMIPGNPFEYTFIDDDFDRMYRAEERTGKVMKYFTFLSICIACLGLFGLASFSAEQRFREIGIRKTFGASVPGITVMLCKEFLKLVLLATLTALPISYYTMNNWLQGYAYRIDLNIVIFASAAALALLTALLTVSYQAMRAALGNPIDALKCQ